MGYGKDNIYIYIERSKNKEKKTCGTRKQLSDGRLFQILTNPENCNEMSPLKYRER